MATINSPLTGKVVDLSEVPDPVFADRAVGDGVAVIPNEDGQDVTVCSPAAGKAMRVMPHAFVILTEEGKGVLVHVGIDTVRLKGEGFDIHTEQGSKVEAGQKMVTFNPKKIREAGYDPIVPVVVMDTKAGDVHEAVTGDITVGDKIFEI